MWIFVQKTFSWEAHIESFLQKNLPVYFLPKKVKFTFADVSKILLLYHEDHKPIILPSITQFIEQTRSKMNKFSVEFSLYPFSMLIWRCFLAFGFNFLIRFYASIMVKNSYKRSQAALKIISVHKIILCSSYGAFVSENCFYCV